MAMNSGKLYAGVARRGAHAPATAASASASSSSSLLWSSLAAVAALAAAAGVLGIPKYILVCVADLAEAEELRRWAAEALGAVVLPAHAREPPAVQRT